VKRIEIVHIGPQKSGTTWLYRCMLEHPEVACPPQDTIHYFDMLYHRGRDWYVGHFRDAAAHQRWFDPTPSYIRSTWAPRRLREENPSARIALCLRNPVERAFSHYWHEKKKLRFDFRFEEVFSNYDLYSSWLETGFYAEHLERYLEHFPREQILCQRFDDLGHDPEGFLDAFCRFAGIADGLRPEVLHRKVNVAGHKRTFISSRVLPKMKGAMRRLGGGVPGLSRIANDETLLSGRSEYARGIPAELVGPLWEACEPEVRRLERLTGLDLSSWRPRAGSAVAT